MSLPSRPPLDLAAFPFDSHPLHCDCETCEAETIEPSLLHSLAACTLYAIAGIALGQLLGRLLEVSGILAMIGIG